MKIKYYLHIIGIVLCGITSIFCSELQDKIDEESSTKGNLKYEWECANIHITIPNSSVPNATIKNVYKDYGKYYNYPDKSQEIQPSDIEGIRIPVGSTVVVAACGRANSPSGTDGSFDVYDGITLAASIKFNAPDSGSNEFSLNCMDPYVGNYKPTPIPQGKGNTLGDVYVKLIKF